MASSTRSRGTSEVSDLTAKVRTVLATLFASVLAILVAASAISARRSSTSSSAFATAEGGFESADATDCCARDGEAIERQRISIPKNFPLLVCIVFLRTTNLWPRCRKGDKLTMFRDSPHAQR